MWPSLGGQEMMEGLKSGKEFKQDEGIVIQIPTYMRKPLQL